MTNKQMFTDIFHAAQSYQNTETHLSNHWHDTLTACDFDADLALSHLDTDYFNLIDHKTAAAEFLKANGCPVIERVVMVPATLENLQTFKRIALDIFAIPENNLLIKYINSNGKIFTSSDHAPGIIMYFKNNGFKPVEVNVDPPHISEETLQQFLNDAASNKVPSNPSLA